MKQLAGLSLGWRTELIFARFDAQISARADHWLIRTPHNPTYWWGNFLLFDRAPREGDAAAWVAAFDEEIVQAQPESRHLAFGIDVAAPFVLPPDFAALGVECRRSTLLTMSPGQLRAPRRMLGTGFEARALRLPEEAALAVEQQVAADQGMHEALGFRVYRERQMQRYGAMQRDGWGEWFGMFADMPHGAPILVADCGLFRNLADGGRLGRFQHVSTHPVWRRRGLCTALIHAVCRHAFDTLGLETLVILADPDDVAIGLYESLGFRRGADTWHIERPAPEDRR